MNANSDSKHPRSLDTDKGLAIGLDRASNYPVSPSPLPIGECLDVRFGPISVIFLWLTLSACKWRFREIYSARFFLRFRLDLAWVMCGSSACAWWMKSTAGFFATGRGSIMFSSVYSTWSSRIFLPSQHSRGRCPRGLGRSNRRDWRWKWHSPLFSLYRSRCLVKSISNCPNWCGSQHSPRRIIP